MKEPLAAPPSPGWMRGNALLPWSWAEERLNAERNYWIVTVRADGFPQARPVWGLWSDTGLFLSVGHGGLQRTEPGAARPVTVHLDSAVETVILEGVLDRIVPFSSGEETAQPTLEVDAAVRRAALERYNAKYDWNFDVDGNGLNFLMRPRVVYGWHAPREIAAASRWTFGD